MDSFPRQHMNEVSIQALEPATTAGAPNGRRVRMQYRLHRWLMTARIAVLAIATAALAATVEAQTAVMLPDAEDPKADELLKKFIKATGLNAILERGAMRTVGTFTMPAMGASGQIEVLQLQPNLMLSRMTIAGLGDIRSGFDGRVGWSMNPMEGPRLIAGAELTQVRDQADFASATRDPRVIAAMETVGQVDVEGRACWKVRVTWKSGRESFDCYDAETGLLHATMHKSETPMGAVDAVTVFGEYRDFDGVMMPARTTQHVFNQQLVVTITSVSFGGLDASAFELPAEIKALVQK
jgi:hypothetical protein